MSIEKIDFEVKGLPGGQLLLNNPRTVDPLDEYAKAAKEITSRKKKSDADHLKLREIETEAKCFWDDSLGIYIPSRWITASIANSAFAVAKIAKAKIRSSVFPVEEKIKLHYEGEREIAAVSQIHANGHFIVQNLKQGTVSITKAHPAFRGWSFKTQLEIDTEILNFSDIKRIAEYASRYVGWGDFRPTFGRADVVLSKAGDLREVA